MDTKQPETLRMADALEWENLPAWPSRMKVVTQLRSLHTENETLRAGYDAARLEIASLQAQLEAVGAGGVTALIAAPAQLVAWKMDKDTFQFLSDVMTAAGLVEHGQQCKALAERLSSGVMAVRATFQAHWAPDPNQKIVKVDCGDYYQWQAAPADDEVVWHGWACQKPGKLPRLYGAREVAELNLYEDEGDRLIFMSAKHGAPDAAAPAQPVTAKQSPHPEYDKGFSDGWNRCEARQAAAQAQDLQRLEFLSTIADRGRGLRYELVTIVHNDKNELKVYDRQNGELMGEWQLTPRAAIDAAIAAQQGGA